MIIIQIVNDGTGNEDVGNYIFSVHINDVCMMRGHLENFERSLGWKELIFNIFEAIEQDEYF